MFKTFCKRKIVINLVIIILYLNKYGIFCDK